MHLPIGDKVDNGNLYSMEDHQWWVFQVLVDSKMNQDMLMC